MSASNTNTTDSQLVQIPEDAHHYWDLFRKSERLLSEQKKIKADILDFVKSSVNPGQVLDEQKWKDFGKAFNLITLKHTVIFGQRKVLLSNLKISGIVDDFVENELMWFGYYTGFVKQGDAEIYGMRIPCDGESLTYLPPTLMNEYSKKQIVDKIVQEGMKKEQEKEKVLPESSSLARIQKPTSFSKRKHQHHHAEKLLSKRIKY